MVAAIILVAVSVGLSNLAAAIGIGVGGIDRQTRIRVGVIFGLFEAAMPVAGLLAGHSLAASLGRAADWLAAGLLVGVGAASVAAGIRSRATPAAAGKCRPRGGRCRPLSREVPAASGEVSAAGRRRAAGTPPRDRVIDR